MRHAPTITEATLEGPRASAKRVVETHRRLSEWLKPGVTLAEIDGFVAQTLRSLQAESCFLRYKAPPHPPFPNHACLSLNECVVHGTSGAYTEPLVQGDLLSVDIGVRHKGWIGDAAWTYAIGHADDLSARLMACGRAAIRAGIEQLQPGKPYIEYARAVQACVERGFGFHCVRGLGGHGYGKKLHEPPYVANSVPAFTGEWPDAMTVAREGTLVAVEPMIAATTPEIRSEGKAWPVYTGDGSRSVHYEHDVWIGPDGPVVLTQGLYDLPDIVGD